MIENTKPNRKRKAHPGRGSESKEPSSDFPSTINEFYDAAYDYYSVVFKAAPEEEKKSLAKLNQLIQSTDFSQVDWDVIVPNQSISHDPKEPMNTSEGPPEGKNPAKAGPTIAYIAAILAVEDKPELLNKLLDSKAEIDWNAGPKDEKHVDGGTTVAYLAALLAGQLKPELLNKLLDSDAKLNWDTCPRNNKHFHQGATLAYLAVDLASLFPHSPGLLSKLLNSNVHINWNAGPQSRANLFEGYTVAYFAAQLANQGQHELLNKLLADPEAQINANACPEKTQHFDHGITVAYFAALLATNRHPELLNKLLADPAPIYWNARPNNEKHLNYGKTLAYFATLLADQNHPKLLQKLLTESKALTIDWDTSLVETDSNVSTTFDFIDSAFTQAPMNYAEQLTKLSISNLQNLKSIMDETFEDDEDNYLQAYIGILLAIDLLQKAPKESKKPAGLEPDDEAKPETTLFTGINGYLNKLKQSINKDISAGLYGISCLHIAKTTSSVVAMEYYQKVPPISEAYAEAQYELFNIYYASFSEAKQSDQQEKSLKNAFKAILEHWLYSSNLSNQDTYSLILRIAKTILAFPEKLSVHNDTLTNGTPIELSSGFIDELGQFKQQDKNNRLSIDLKIGGLWEILRTNNQYLRSKKETTELRKEVSDLKERHQKLELRYQQETTELHREVGDLKKSHQELQQTVQLLLAQLKPTPDKVETSLRHNHFFG